MSYGTASGLRYSLELRYHDGRALARRTSWWATGGRSQWLLPRRCCLGRPCPGGVVGFKLCWAPD